MTITDKARKILWARSGNLCALCRRSLVAERTPSDDEAVVGDEAHIEARSPGGPRYRPQMSTDVDDYQNLILLCRVDHKRVDDQPRHYTTAYLKEIKREHETWVKQTLTRQASPQHAPQVERQRRAQTLATYRTFRAALDHLDRVTDAVVDANVVLPDDADEGDLHRQCAEAWQSAYLACGHFSAVCSQDCAMAAEYLLSRWKSLAGDAVDGLLPSSHPAADSYNDIELLDDELLDLLSAELGMVKRRIWDRSRPVARLG